MRKIDYSKIRNIIILRLGKIGDLIISSFVFSAIKKFNPESKIYLVTLKKNEDVLRVNPDIDEIYSMHQNVLEISKLFPLKFNIKTDLIIDLNDNDSKTSAFLLNFFKAKYKLGFNFSSQSKYLTHLINQPDKEKTHLIERYAHLLKESGLPISDEEIKPIMYLDPEIEKNVLNELNQFKTHYKLIGINISAGANIRRYPIEKWNELIKALRNKYESIKFIILHDWLDKKEARMITGNFNPDYFIQTSGDTFQHFAAKIKNLDLLITPDTSAVHLCSTFQIPVIALYPNVKWNFVSFAPYKTPYKSILSNSEEIKNIPVEKIIDSFEELIHELRWTL